MIFLCSPDLKMRPEAGGNGKLGVLLWVCRTTSLLVPVAVKLNLIALRCPADCNVDTNALLWKTNCTI